jgi:phosphomevalonate kinase
MKPTEKVADSQKQQVIQLLQTKASERAIEEQTKLSRRQIRKIKQEVKVLPLTEN